MNKFDRASRRALVLARKRIRIRVRNTTTIMTLTYYAAMCLVLLVGGLKVLNGDATVGRLTEFLAFMTILQLPVRQLGMMVNAFARASSSGQRLFEVLDQEPDVANKPGAPPLTLTRGVLRFEDVSFSYRTEDGDTVALQGVSFAVGPGQTLGIVGPPGGGQVHHRPPGAALLRRHRRAHHHRRPGHPRYHPGLSAQRGRGDPAGQLRIHLRPGKERRLRRSLGRARAHRACHRNPRNSTPMCAACRSATTPWWASAACRCRAASASACRSPAA